MASLSVLRARADELREQHPKMTPLRVFDVLRKEFRHAERDHLVVAARLEGHPKGITPGWGKLHPVVARWQPKGRPEEPVIVSTRKVLAVDYPLITIEARELRQGDWIEGGGHVAKLGNYSTMMLVTFPSDEHKFFRPREPVQVRLEDKGETE